MLDFLMISTRSSKRSVIEIYPKFIVGKKTDLMIKGGDFHAVWIEEKGLWSTDEQDVISIVDNELDKYYEEHKNKYEGTVKVLHMWDSETGMIDIWHKYVQKQQRDFYKTLNRTLIYSNQESKKEDYASKKLTYPLEKGPHKNFDELITTLYSENEARKIEWAIGCIAANESQKTEKFLVLYGTPGTGKGTILKIIQKLFNGYTAVFDASAIGSSSEFALEQLKSNPLVAIQYDGDLSRIENNARLNSLISHEPMVVNEKHKSLYTETFSSFLLLGTNRPVKISDNKSGIKRRLIDVSPLGVKIPKEKYLDLMKAIEFELGHIAYYCREIYLNNPTAYDDYVPTLMMSESNDFYNFVLDNYIIFKKDDGVTLKAAWEMYKQYVEDAKVQYPLSMRAFKSELRTYFKDYQERVKIDNMWIRSYYCGFKAEIFDMGTDEDTDADSMVLKQTVADENKKDVKIDGWLKFDSSTSNLDTFCADCPAQYASSKETPQKKWADVKTTLSDLDTSKLHYLKVPNNLIVIDFDLRDEKGEKSFELNLKEANKWPKTYAELSKSSGGIHLHYIYNGDVNKLSCIYADNIEVKIFTGNSSLRRKLSKCTSDQISTISSGLPLKGDTKVINFEAIKNEKALRTIIKKNLNKEYHGATKPSVDFIYKVLEDAYNNGINYDVSDMHDIILAFAASSTNQSDYCLKLVTKMHFKSDDYSKTVVNDEQPIVFYDVEVFPNLFLINWKFEGENKQVVRMINPTAKEVENLLKYRLVGFNCRRYDNHMLYARLIGYTNEDLYDLSQRIIHGDRKAFFGEAYNISYTDIYDYASTKQSLKKWEIELGIHHQELGLPWNKPVDEKLWFKVAEYCDNDVISTEAVWNATKDDFLAREILADIADMSVNDTTNTLTTKIIFGNEKHPQLVYTDLSKEFPGYEFIKKWNNDTKKYDLFNMYRGTELGRGGYVYAEPGMYGNVALLDINSLHPSSAINLNLFGEYTQKFKDLVDIRLLIKHEKFDEAKKLFGGKLAKYLDDADNATKLAKALKIAINSVYGLTSASFDNPFRDPRNENNIVALRGALFMRTLQDEVVKRGYKAIHIKTDSIKIPDATKEIIDFCMDFAKKYGYVFEHEAIYDRMCLVNDAVYIAKYKTIEDCNKLYGKDYIESSADVISDNKKAEKKNIIWTATGTQFQVPYVFKKLFSGESIEFKDLCETKSVTDSAIYLDMNEDTYNAELEIELIKVLELRKAIETDPEFKLTKVKIAILSKYENVDSKDIENKLLDMHSLKFVGRIGLFVPIKPGKGGGILVREMKTKDRNIKYDSVVGTKGYRWLEAEDVVNNHKESDVDMDYHNNLINEAKKAISQYGDFEWFVSDDPYIQQK